MSLPTILLLLCLYFSCSSPSTLPIGIHPLDEKFYEAEVNKCKDGSKNFTRDRLNDNFCDCPDGTDEPGTSACPASKFYCRNVGSTPKFLFSSHVNDHICGTSELSKKYQCLTSFGSLNLLGNKTPTYQTGETRLQENDCCDGSDEYDGIALCPNSCVMGGNVAYQTINYGSDAKRGKSGLNAEDSSQKLSGLKVAIIIQAAFIIFVVAFRLFRRRGKGRRKNIR